MLKGKKWNDEGNMDVQRGFTKNDILPFFYSYPTKHICCLKSLLHKHFTFPFCAQFIFKLSTYFFFDIKSSSEMQTYENSLQTPQCTFEMNRRNTLMVYVDLCKFQFIKLNNSMFKGWNILNYVIIQSVVLVSFRCL